MVEDPLQLLRIKCIADEQGDGVLGKLTIDLKLFFLVCPSVQGVASGDISNYPFFCLWNTLFVPKIHLFPTLPRKDLAWNFSSQPVLLKSRQKALTAKEVTITDH